MTIEIKWDRPELPKGLDDTTHLIESTYECPCGETWTGVWDSACDDDCGACGKTISPSDHDDVEGCKCPGCYIAPLQNGEGMGLVFDLADTFVQHWATDEGQDRDEQAQADIRARQLENLKPFMIAAADAFQLDTVRKMTIQLQSIRHALERARDTLAICGETHPADDVAGDCEAGAQDAVESIYFLDQVLLSLPVVIPPANGEVMRAIADAKLAARPPKVAILMEGGLVEQVVCSREVDVVVVDHNAEGEERRQLLLAWDDADTGCYALGCQPAVSVEPGITFQFFAEAAALAEHRRIDEHYRGDKA